MLGLSAVAIFKEFRTPEQCQHASAQAQARAYFSAEAYGGHDALVAKARSKSYGPSNSRQCRHGLIEWFSF